MIGWIAWILTPVGAAIVVSLVFAAVTSTMMLALYLRRLGDEQRSTETQAEDLVISRQLLALLRGDGGTTIAELPDMRPGQAERIFSHLMLLVRGEDRDHLLDLADRIGLPDFAIASLGDSRPARRVDAMRTLEAFPVPRAAASLRHTMATDRQYDVRLEAAGALARLRKLPQPSTIIAELDLTNRPLSRVHEAIFRAAAADHAGDMIALSSDPAFAKVRPLIVEALGWSGDYFALPVLQCHAGDPDPDVRSAALKAARRIAHPSVATWVLPMLLDPVDYVRVQAALTCGKLGLRDAIPVLATLVHNPSWWVRTRAAEALALLRPAQAAPIKHTGLRT